MEKCCCSVAKLCLTLCDLMDRSMPGFPVLHYIPEFAQTHVHWVSDAIHPSHPLSPSSPPALNLFQCQGLFQWGGCSFILGGQSIWASASVLLMHIWGWIPSGLTDLISQQSSPTAQFKSINSLALSFLYGPPLTSIHDYGKNHSFD